MAHEQKGIVFFLLGKKLDGQVGGYFDRVSGDDLLAFGRNVIGFVITSLPWVDHPLIESGRVCAQVPFSEYCSPVADLLQEFGEGHLLGVEPVSVSLEAILVAVLPRKNASSARPADRIGAKVSFEDGSFPGNPVNIRSLVDFRTVSRDGLGGMIVREDEYDVRLFGSRNEGECKKAKKK